MIELLLQAERALSMGLVDQAEHLYRQAAAADARNSIAVVGLARVALERDDEETAWREARRALGIDPENAAAQRMVARLEEVWRYRGRPLPGDAAPYVAPAEEPPAEVVAELEAASAAEAPDMAEEVHAGSVASHNGFDVPDEGVGESAAEAARAPASPPGAERTVEAEPPATPGEAYREWTRIAAESQAMADAGPAPQWTEAPARADVEPSAPATGPDAITIEAVDPAEAADATARSEETADTEPASGEPAPDDSAPDDSAPGDSAPDEPTRAGAWPPPDQEAQLPSIPGIGALRSLFGRKRE